MNHAFQCSLGLFSHLIAGTTLVSGQKQKSRSTFFMYVAIRQNGFSFLLHKTVSMQFVIHEVARYI